MTENSAADHLYQMLFGTRHPEVPLHVVTVWIAVQAWWRIPIADLSDAVEEALGFEASLTLPTDAASDEPQWISLAFFRQIGADEQGIELWFPVDDGWNTAIRASNWDWTHPIGFHAWGKAGTNETELSSVVEESALFHAAVRHPCESARLFATHSRDIVIGTPPPAG
jgi:hypothetical protein